MSGLGRVVVGYRDGPKLERLRRGQGQECFPTRGCVGCGRTVFFVRSGFDAARYRDASPICEECFADDRDAVEAAL